MERLPVERWKVQFSDTGILVGAYCNGPDGRDLYWVKIKFSDFSKNVTGIDDLKHTVIETLKAAPIPQDEAATSFERG